jgi:hypothetical protein
MAVSALQHIPIQLSTNPALLPSLIVLPQNEAYWQILLKSARKIRRWSIPIIVNILWVVISSFLTIIDTFYSPVPGEIGYGTVTSLAYLLPLMIGWLHVGSEPEQNHLRDSLEEANSVALVATDGGDEPVLAKSLVGRPKWAIEVAKGYDVDPARRDELKTNPIFNYSRVFIWSLNAEVIFTLVRNAAVKEERYGPIHRSPEPETDGTIKGRNCTAYEAICYCTAEDSPFERFFGAPRPIIPLPLGSSKSYNTSAGLLPFFVSRAGTREPSIWATGALKRVAFTTCVALALQWGTTGAGILIYYEMHPIGLGCRTTSLLIYAILGTLSFFLLLASSIFAHLSRPRPGSKYRYSRSQSFQQTAAILCRWFGKGLGMIAGLGMLVISLVQPLGIFDNCWCSTKTFDRPAEAVAFMVGNFASQWGVLKDWIGGLAMAFVTVSLYGFVIYLGTPRVR